MISFWKGYLADKPNPIDGGQLPVHHEIKSSQFVVSAEPQISKRNYQRPFFLNYNYKPINQFKPHRNGVHQMWISRTAALNSINSWFLTFTSSLFFLLRFSFQQQQKVRFIFTRAWKSKKSISVISSSGHLINNVMDMLVVRRALELGKMSFPVFVFEAELGGNRSVDRPCITARIGVNECLQNERKKKKQDIDFGIERRTPTTAASMRVCIYSTTWNRSIIIWHRRHSHNPISKTVAEMSDH